jgi:hypothetical protein
MKLCQLIFLVLISILLLQVLTACQTGLVIEKDSTPSVQALPTPSGPVTSPATGGEIGLDLPSGTSLPESNISVETKEISLPQAVVIDFLRDVTQGDLWSAMNYWEPEARNQAIQNLAANWASGEYEFVIGEVSYAGFIAPGDYRPLEAGNPRVQDALVVVSIDGFQGSFALEKTSSGWLISGWIEE